MHRLVQIGALGAALLALVVAGGLNGASAADPPVICLDPGHSTLAGGASVEVKVGRGRNAEVTTLTEAEVNVDIAREVARQLREDHGLTVVLTWGEADGLPGRTWDPLLGPAVDDPAAVEARGAFCELHGSGLVASLHTNALNVPFNGTLTGYRDGDDLALAELAHPMIFDELGVTSEGDRIGKFRNFGLEQADWWISLGAPDSAVAVFEPVLMTDRSEAKRLLPGIAEGGARRQQIADVEAAAIAAYVETLGP